MLCKKWVDLGIAKVGHNRSPLISDEGLDLDENKRRSKQSNHNKNRAFVDHNKTKLHAECLELEANKAQLGELWAENLEGRKESDVICLLHKLVYRLKKDNCPDKSYERAVDFLDSIAVPVGSSYHHALAAKEITTNISDGMFEQEQLFMATKREQTGRVPFLGQTGDEVSVQGRTFDLQQFQVIERGRPKQLHLKSEEMKIESVTGQSLFEASDKNLK